MDFIQDSLWPGRKYRILSIVETFIREYLAIEAATSIPSGEDLGEYRGLEGIAEFNPG